MCGIAGFVNLDGREADATILRRMRDAIRHRGPDDEGLWAEQSTGLAHRRLSILDLSPLGHQPMVSQDERAIIVFNGEIFNFLELRAELEGRGHTFHSHSDTEVLLHMWQQHGPRCLNRLVGMFAFAIWDRSSHTLHAARDRAGIKPFHYAHINNTFLFGSEVKALLAHPSLSPRLDPAGFADFQFAGYPMAGRTLFDGVRELPPGHWLTVDAAGVRIEEYWRPQYSYDRIRDHQATADELGIVLDNAVELHCRSDAPLGSHLSGGLDSSTVALFAGTLRPGLTTFSIRFDSGGPYDESAYAREVAAVIGSAHHEDQPALDDIERMLPFLVHHVEQPLTGSAVAYFAASRLAARYVTVALTGHGGDEVFGGYAAQFALAYGRGGPTSATPGERSSARRARLEFLLRSEGLRGVLGRFRGGQAIHAASGIEEQWILSHCNRPEAAQSPSLTRAFRASLAGYSPAEDFLVPFRAAPTDELFDKCLYHDLRSYLPSLLHVEDRTSMAMSIESRVPLLDHRVIEFAMTVPPEIKVPGLRSKQLLRTVTDGRLPDRVRLRNDKGAFPVPIHAWLRGDLFPFVKSLLLSDRALGRGVYTPSWIKACVAMRRRLWPLVMFELWARLFLDRDSALNAMVAEFGDVVRAGRRRS